MSESGPSGDQLTHINLARSWRGGERQTELLISELARRGWRQQFIGRRGGEMAERLVGVAGLTVTTARGAAGAAWRVTSSLIHAHEARAAQAAWLASRFGSRRYLLTRRVTNRPSDSRITERVYRDADAVCAVSESVAAVLRERFDGIAPTVIPDGWATPAFDPARAAAIRDRYGGSLLVGCVTALEASKGVQILIDAARSLLPTRREMTILVIGDGKDAPAFRAQAEGIERLIFTGFVRNVGDHLAAMDILVLPSLREGLGSVILEAMANRVPVIASATGGIPELIDDDVNGLLVPPGDPQVLATRLSELADDSDRRRRLADAAAMRIEDLHIEAMADRYERVYERVTAAIATAAQRSSDRPA